jgi:tetratricopeptide (TPR) repeat protein
VFDPDAAIERGCALHERAVAFRAQGDPLRARRACLQARSLFEKASGRSHPDVANVLLELAGSDLDLGMLADATRAVDRAMAILAPLARRMRGDIDIARLLVQALVRKGEVLVARGAYREAERPCKQAIAVAEDAIEADEDIAFALNALGVVYKYTSRFRDAELLYRRALALTVRARGRSDPSVASILHNLGGLEHARGRFARAEPYARRSVAIRERALGLNHPQVAADIAALAAILDGRGKREEAETLLRRAIAIFMDALGKEHFERATGRSVPPLHAGHTHPTQSAGRRAPDSGADLDELRDITTSSRQDQRGRDALQARPRNLSVDSWDQEPRDDGLCGPPRHPPRRGVTSMITARPSGGETNRSSTFIDQFAAIEQHVRALR